MVERKAALVTGITGQDGIYLARLLVSKGYEVHGLCRRSARDERCPHRAVLEDVTLHHGDLCDASGLVRALHAAEPHEVYNLAAQSHVQVSFEVPEYTADADALGTLRLLEAIRVLGMKDRTRFYQASTSELYGNAIEVPQTEATPFHPRSPYGVAKLYAYWITVNYREAYGLHASNGILFNHESPLRGDRFVTRKITRAVAAIATGKLDRLRIGNLDAVRDWGHARDYVEGMWLMLQQDEPGDYVLASGEGHSVRELVELAFAAIGHEIVWRGAGVDEVGADRKTGRVLVEVAPEFFRPAEVDHLRGDSSKAREKLGWRPTTSFAGLVDDMVGADLAQAREGQERATHRRQRAKGRRTTAQVRRAA